MHRPRALSDLLGSGSPRLEQLSRRARSAVALREQVQAALPASLALHITAAAQRQQELTIWVDSGAFCARLRFEIPKLRSELTRATGATLDRIRIRVQPGQVNPALSSGGRSAHE